MVSKEALKQGIGLKFYPTKLLKLRVSTSFYLMPYRALNAFKPLFYAGFWHTAT